MMILEQRQLRHQVRQGIPRDQVQFGAGVRDPSGHRLDQSTFTAQRVREPVEFRVRSPYL